jgi:glycosyltransferase involved in cell wall biosynthesis
MRIACIMEMAGSRFEGGRELATRQLMHCLRKRGVHVDIFSFSEGIPHVLPRFFRETPFLRAVTAFPLAGRGILKSLNGEYDLIHITSTSTASLYSPSTPTLLFCHGVISHKWEKFDFPLRHRLIVNRFSQAVMAWFERRCIENVQAVVAVHPMTLEFIERRLDTGKTKKHILGNGVDVDMFRPSDSEGEGVLFTGRATKSKGFDVLLEAAPEIKAPVTAVVYQVDQKLVDEASRRGVEVITDVPHAEMPSLYRRASVFVLPSIDEELPLSTLEALACGLPVVVSGAAAAGIVEEGRNGFIIPTGDPDSLADAVNMLLDDDGLRMEMKGRNRRLAEESLSWDDVAERLLQIYMELAEGYKATMGGA